MAPTSPEFGRSLSTGSRSPDHKRWKRSDPDYRVPAPNWKPAGWVPPAESAENSMITDRHVHLDVAWKTPQFWLVWGVLCLNVTAGIGIIGMASPMLQED